VSSVRMCDNAGCGRIFSENDDGWATGVVAVQRRRENGTRFMEQQQSDRCNTCSGVAPPAPTLGPPQLPAAPTAADEAAAAEQADDHEMLRQLQRELSDLRAGREHPPAPADAVGTVVDEPTRM
jgi:hypothetical protein